MGQSIMIRNYSDTPILSTGGYNDDFLRHIGHSFNTQIIKCRGDILQFMISAIDYIDNFTNDCFFTFQSATVEKFY